MKNQFSGTNETEALWRITEEFKKFRDKKEMVDKGDFL